MNLGSFAIGVVLLTVCTFLLCAVVIRLFLRVGGAFSDWAVKGEGKRVKKELSRGVGKTVTAAELLDRGDGYVKKGQLLTEPEKILFKVLQYKYGDTHHVFAQVRVVDVIQPNTELYEEGSREWLALFRQVSQWHFDFVICEKETMDVVRVIELDDASHKRKERVVKDKKKDLVCKSAKIHLERLEVSSFLKPV